MSLRRGLRRGWPTALTLAAAVLTTACHTYTPVNTALPGETVRIQIPLRSPLDDPNAPPRTASVEGQLVDNGDTLRLATRNRMEFGAFREIVQYDTLRLARDQVYQMEVREFSTGRSVALGVGLAAVVTGAAALAFGFGGGNAGEGLPENPPQPTIVSSIVSGLVGLVVGN